MLFTKKTKFEVNESRIKEDLTAPDGTVLLRLNLHCPDIRCPKGDPLRVHAAPLYPRLAEELAGYAKQELFKAALAAYTASPSDFLPFSAVMRWEKTFENEKYLSILLDVSVSDGKNPPSSDRKTQIWDRKQGTKCRFSHFFTRESLEYIKNLAPDNRHFDRELFVIRDDRFEFFVRRNNDYTSLNVPLEISLAGAV